MKKLLHTATSLLLAATLLASPAYARQETFGAARVAFNVPDEWATTTQGNSVIVRAPAGLAVEFHQITNAGQIAADVAQLDRVLASRIQNLQWDTPVTPVTQNGLRGNMRRGHGLLNGNPVGFITALVGHRAGGALVIAWVGQQNFQSNIPVLVAVLNSLRAV